MNKYREQGDLTGVAVADALKPISPCYIVAGTRNFHDYARVKLQCDRLIPANATVVSGGANGADALGERWSKESGRECRVVRADWNTYGRGAGPMRNAEMAAISDVLIAFWDGVSPGTRNMIDIALREGLEVHVFRY